MSKIGAEERATLKGQMAKAYGTEAAHEFIDLLRSR